MIKKKITNTIYWSIFIVFAVLLSSFIIYRLPINSEVYSSSDPIIAIATSTLPSETPPPPKISHIETPESVKALYMTNWVAGNVKRRDVLVKLVDDTELNSIVIDIKDYTGKIGFKTDNAKLNEIGSEENRIPDVKDFIQTLHDKGIYVIGRISVFQDSYLVKKFPEYAVKTGSGSVWKDYKGVSWLDVDAKPVWDYIVEIGNESYKIGFDELNFDYIRFPSDGNMKDIAYPYSEGKVKSEAMEEFFSHIDNIFRPRNIPISADLFGMTTTNTDDLGIGQVLEDALEHFDFVAPMVYPSHYPANFNGWKNPAAKPYEIIYFSMGSAYERAVAASTTPMKLRPWLQDFSINGTSYTSDMVRAQKQAVYDVGLNSWMMWNASNNYTTSAFDPFSTTTIDIPSL